MKRMKAVPLYAVIILFSLLSLFPFYVMLIMGTYINEDLFTGVKLLPGTYFFENLKTVLKANFFNFYKNSLYITLITSICGVFISSLAGFSFAKYKFKFKNILFLFILGTLMVPGQMGLVGFVIEMKWFHMMNTHWALILPGVANAFGVFWITKYMESSVPNEMLESARVDGSSDFRTFLRIVLPLVKPALITLFLLSFLGAWNSYMIPLVVLTDESLYTIPLAIGLLGSIHRTDFAARIVALVMSTLPVIIMFSFGSKYLIQGLTAGSIKG